MTKQEEIREMIALLIADACYRYFDERTKANAKPDYFINFNALFEADKIISCEHSQGVAIKVDRELPESFLIDTLSKYNLTRWQFDGLMLSLFRLGYEAVEPLIEKAK